MQRNEKADELALTPLVKKEMVSKRNTLSNDT